MLILCTNHDYTTFMKLSDCSKKYSTIVALIIQILKQVDVCWDNVYIFQRNDVTKKKKKVTNNSSIQWGSDSIQKQDCLYIHIVLHNMYYMSSRNTYPHNHKRHGALARSNSLLRENGLKSTNNISIYKRREKITTCAQLLLGMVFRRNEGIREVIFVRASAVMMLPLLN